MIRSLKNLFRHKLLIRIAYKSGIERAFWAYAFTSKGGQWKWEACYQHNMPVVLGADEIESVFQDEIRWFGRSIWTWISIGVGFCFWIYSGL